MFWKVNINQNHTSLQEIIWRKCKISAYIIGCSKIFGDMGIRVFWEELFALIAGRPSELPKSCVFCCGRASKGGHNPSGIDLSLAAFGGLATTENATFWQFWGSPCDQGEKFFSKNSDSHIPQKFWNTLLSTQDTFLKVFAIFQSFWNLFANFMKFFNF